MGLEFWILLVIAPILGGLLSAASFIVARKPEADALISKLVPYQAIIGVGMLVVFLVLLVDGFLGASFKMLEFKVLIGLNRIATMVSLLLVGFLLGFGLIAQWIPGQGSAETKALDLQKKLMVWQVPLGLLALVCGIVNVLIRFIYF